MFTGVATAILIAVGTGSIGYVIQQISDHRRAEIAALNTKIEKLYGPLYAITRANDETWTAFYREWWSNEQKNGKVYFDDRDPPSIEQVRMWRLWMRSVFQPLNLRAEDLIVSNAQLIVGPGYPKAFDAMVAHTESYKAIIAAWELSDKSGSTPSTLGARNIPLLPYPKNLSKCVEREYQQIVSERDRLENSYFYIGKTKHTMSPECNQ